jgi:LPS export ABC transporter protein LptC
VVVVREADAKNELTRLTTDKLLVLPDEGIARTSSDILLESASTRAHAKGMELNNRTRTMQLDQVRASIQPKRR